MKFRTVVLLGILAVVVFGLAATVIAVGVTLERAARGELVADLVSTREVFEDLAGYRQSLVAANARVTAEEPRLKAVVASEEVSRDTIVGVAEEIGRVLGSDLFLLLDARAQILCDLANPQAKGDLSQNPTVAKALKNGDAEGIFTDAQRAYQVHASRLVFGTTTVGVLVVGQAIDDEAAETVRRQTRAEVVVELEGKTVARSGFVDGQVSSAALAEALRPVAGGDAPSEVSLGGVRYLAIAAPYPAYHGAARLRYVVLRSLDRALAIQRRLYVLLFGIAALGVALALAVAVGVSRRLSRPLDALVALTRRVSAGQLEERVTPAGPREIQALGISLNDMAQELAVSRRELVAKERLEKEMEVAQRIQISMLPKNMLISGLEVCARMEPASEVGGDYYDVLPATDGCWLAIGDVAGHGLNAGLVMLMIQSVVSAATKSDPVAPPNRVWSVLNQVYFDNVLQRLDRREHTTLALLRYYKDGRVIMAGAHEHVLVWRKATGRVEAMATLGTWLGLVQDATAEVVDTSFLLEDGDLLVLYTDGAIEAMDKRGEQFGLERLCREIEGHADKSVAQVRDHLCLGILAWAEDRSDDVTVVVARHEAR
jgi:sigma-B regulation protein RsbU (phosphoserine phosphatase)